jgi:hypothetical protein
MSLWSERRLAGETWVRPEDVVRLADWFPMDSALSPAASPATPSPPRVTVRATIVGTEPAVVRVLDLDARLSLSQLNVALQVAFGWEDFHLHDFSRDDPDEFGHPDSARWTTLRQIFGMMRDGTAWGRMGDEEWDQLGNVFTPEDPTLHYSYDYGDNWHVRIDFLGNPENETAERTPPARLVGAENHAPFEDSGGVGGWERLKEILADPQDEEYAETVAWARISEPDVAFDPARVDVDGINAELATKIPSPRFTEDDAVPRPADQATAARMVAPFAALLRVVGPDGLRLNQGDRLPPGVVGELVEELGWQKHVDGPLKEDSVSPVASLRAHARRFGLVRLSHGTLYVTKAGGKLLEDPVALLGFIVQRACAKGLNNPENVAGVLVAAALGTGRNPIDFEQILQDTVETMAWMGWGNALGSPWGPGLSIEQARYLSSDIVDLLRMLSAFDPPGYDVNPGPTLITPEGCALARAIVLTAQPDSWPGPFA